MLVGFQMIMDRIAVIDSHLIGELLCAGIGPTSTVSFYTETTIISCRRHHRYVVYVYRYAYHVTSA